MTGLEFGSSESRILRYARSKGVEISRDKFGGGHVVFRTAYLDQGDLIQTLSDQGEFAGRKVHWWSFTTGDYGLFDATVCFDEYWIDTNIISRSNIDFVIDRYELWQSLVEDMSEKYGFPNYIVDIFNVYGSKVLARWDFSDGTGIILYEGECKSYMRNSTKVVIKYYDLRRRLQTGEAISRVRREEQREEQRVQRENQQALREEQKREAEVEL